MPKRGPSSSARYARGFAPDSQYVTFRYAGSTTFALSSGVGLYQFRGNSPYDPDFTNVGAQPVGYDEWSAIYSRYRVMEADMTMFVSADDAGSTIQAAMFAIGAGSSGAPSAPSADVCAAFPYSVQRQVTYGAPAAKLKLHLPVHKLFGCPKGQVEFDDTFQGAFTQNPSRIVWISAGFTGSGTEAVTITWELKMKTKVYDIAALSLSLTRPRVVVAPSVEDAAKITTTANAGCRPFAPETPCKCQERRGVCRCT